MRAEQYMKNFSKIALLLLTFQFNAGCGYVKAGTWKDDPRNWNRAFESTKPSDVTVVHSEYWRAPHWTYEFEYYFEIWPNAKLKEQLFGKNKLRRVKGDEAAAIKKNVFGDAPSWFAPKDLAEYEVWVYEDEPNSNFKVLIDKQSGVMFLNDYQV
jgi:hypothetical protein